MKRIALLLSAIFICSAAHRVYAQDEKQATPEQKAWMEYATPGPMHDIFKTGEGKWKVHTTFWMKPNDQPQSSDGEAESKLVLGGRYLQTEMHGKFMGQDYEGMGYDGYDNALGEYVSTWMDNMGTGIMFIKGKMDPATKVVSYEGKMVNPQTKKEEDSWATFTQTDADHQKFEMFAKAKGKKFKTMEMTYEREK
jgi:hypothetical protein